MVRGWLRGDGGRGGWPGAEGPGGATGVARDRRGRGRGSPGVCQLAGRFRSMRRAAKIP
jgi:hypothetical protein